MEDRIGTTAGLAIGGPALMGAVLGLPLGLAGMAAGALALPAIVFGVALLTSPALYIGASLVGIAPPASDSLRAGVRALRASGLVLLGLAAPAAFLLATTAPAGAGAGAHEGVRLFALAVVGGAALAGFRKAYHDLFRLERVHDHVTAFVLFGAWALMTSLMGAKLLIDSFA